MGRSKLGGIKPVIVEGQVAGCDIIIGDLEVALEHGTILT